MVDYVATFNASLARVSDGGLKDSFLERFYERFVASDVAIAQKFCKTDMEHQKRMLGDSFAELREFSGTLQTNPYLIALARTHGIRGHDVAAAWYDRWLDALVQTVREVDPQANNNVELAWRIVMAPGIEFMKYYRDK